MGGIWSAVFCFGGKTGIRTLGTVARSPHFECGPIDHSGIFPCSVGKVTTFCDTRAKSSKKVWGNSEIRSGKWSFAGLFPSWRLNLTI